MADFMTKTQRSRAMAAVPSSETEIERTVRCELHRAGFRFRKNVRDFLPGRPDIVLPKYRCIIFVHGCFWHQHKNCKRSKLPATRREFWTKKIGENVKRDHRQITTLRTSGWRVLIVWECEVKRAATPQKVVKNLISNIMSTLD